MDTLVTYHLCVCSTCLYENGLRSKTDVVLPFVAAEKTSRSSFVSPYKNVERFTPIPNHLGLS